MGRASLLRENRKMLFEEVHSVWMERRLTQEEARQLLGPRTGSGAGRAGTRSTVDRDNPT